MIETRLCRLRKTYVRSSLAVDRVGGRNRRGGDCGLDLLSRTKTRSAAKATASGGDASTFPRPAQPDRIEVLLRDAEQASRRLDRLIRRAELLDPAHDSSLPGVSTADIESDPMEVAVREGLSQGESAESLAEALGVTPAEIEEMISRLQSTAAGSEGSDA